MSIETIAEISHMISGCFVIASPVFGIICSKKSITKAIVHSKIMPVWRNGRRGRLKIYSGQPGAGSSPAIGILSGNRFGHEPVSGFFSLSRLLPSIVLHILHAAGQKENSDDTI